MKRLRRLLFNLAAVVSLMICVATSLVWFRSCFACDELGYAWNTSISGNANRYQRAGIVTLPGSLAVFYVFTESSGTFDSGFYLSKAERMTRTTSSIWNRLGFFAELSTLTNAAGISLGSWFVQTPCWPVVGVTGLFPGWHFWKRRRRKLRAAKNLCISCGYDLRATPERCPECGAIPRDANGSAGPNGSLGELDLESHRRAIR